MTDNEAPLLFILYGSATGNAEHIAKDLAASARQQTNFFRSINCMELDEFVKKKVESTWQEAPAIASQKHGLVIVCSTTGNGDAPENASRFTRYVKKCKTAPESGPLFQHCVYALLGLGDTNYDVFCGAAKTLDKQLSGGPCGATRILPTAYADEGTGTMEETVEPWTAQVVVRITKACRGGVPAETTDSAATTPSTTADHDAPLDSNRPRAPSQSLPCSSSRGVQIVRALQSHQDTEAEPSARSPSLTVASNRRIRYLSTSTTVVEPPNSSTPAVSDDEWSDNDESSPSYYSARRPYCSTVVAARYLTQQTSAPLASVVAHKDNACDQLLDEHFVLPPYSANTRNGTAFNECYFNGKRVLEVTLALPGGDQDQELERRFSYQPGDSIGLLVTNQGDAVDFVFLTLTTNGQNSQLHSIDQVVAVLDANDDGDSVSIQSLLSSRIDLCSPMHPTAGKRMIHYFLQALAPGLENAQPAEEFQEEYQVLQLLYDSSSSSKQQSSLFHQYICLQRISVYQLLLDFPATLQAHLTLEMLVTACSPIAPRYYSISSSPLSTPLDGTSTLKIAFSVVDYLTPPVFGGSSSSAATEYGHTRIRGVATRYLESTCLPLLVDKPSGTDLKASLLRHVRIFPKPTGDFRLPEDLSVPLIMFGPGTGIAPFIGMLSHRQELIRKQVDTLSVGSVEIFFGCRHECHDYIYQEELEQFHRDGIVTHLHAAFSRDPPADATIESPTLESCQVRRYVQDCFLLDPLVARRLVESIVQGNAMVYICGDGNAMAKDVQAALVQAIARYGGERLQAEADADALDNVATALCYFNELKQQHRIRLDIWS
jgi:sulfite reductase alpha subunit-like flavoprotein